MLTPSERRGALIVLALLALGSAWDAWRAAHPDLRELATPGADGNASPGAPAGGVVTTPSPAPSADSSDALRFRDRNAAGGRARAVSRGRGKAPPTRPIDLNRAGTDEFHALPGIGPVLAGRIVEYRRAHGRFGSVEELLAVRGIGPHLFERIRPYVRV